MGLGRGIDLGLESGLRCGIGVGRSDNSGWGDISRGAGGLSKGILRWRQASGGRLWQHCQRLITGFLNHVPHSLRHMVAYTRVRVGVILRFRDISVVVNVDKVGVKPWTFPVGVF